MPAPPPSPVHPADRRFKRAYWRLGRLLLGADAMAGSWQKAEYDDARATEMEERVRLGDLLAGFTRRVARGEDPGTAYVSTVRVLAAAGQLVLARAFCEGQAAAVPADLVRVARAICLYRMRRYDVVWDQLAEVDPAVLARHALVVAVDTALSLRTPEANAVARAVVSDPSYAETGALPRLAGRFLVAGERDVARALHDEAEKRPDLDDKTRQLLDNLVRWLGEPAVVEVPAGRVKIGVFDYHQPDLVPGAGNVGDLVQTLALLANLARFQGVRFHGAGGAGALAQELQQRVRPALRLEGPAADVELLPVSRDYSEGDPIPADTWTIAFGWHLRPLYRIRYGLPYHPHLRPIFVAFHLNHVRALTPEAIDYLRAHGPIGCRDWTTVDLLLSAGVDAFFTGCLTSTVDAVFPDRDDVERDGDRVVAAIDVPADSVQARRPVEEISHMVSEWHTVDFAGGVRAADQLLGTYLRRYHRVVTSRLHSYLPATSLGIPVEFRPNVPGDVRFDGLLGMEPGGEAFVAMRDGIRTLLAEALGLILAGASPDEVYARWREVTAERVREARARFTAPPRPVEGGVDVVAAVATVRASIQPLGPHERADPASVSDIAVSLDSHYRALLPVTLESLTSNASGPLRVFVTARGLDTAYRTWLSASFPDVPFTFLTYDDVDYGRITRMLGHVSVATMDRLLLPEVLSDVDRITYVDIDTVTLGDVTELARTDLGGLPLAGRTERFIATEVWRRAGDLLGPADAHELRRTMAAAHGFGGHTFNAGVMVLDLDRMRRDRFVERFVPMASRFGLHDQDVLNAYTGPHRAELDPRWNSFPVAESLPDPQILHYAGAGKPWEELVIPGGHWWRQYAAQFAARATPMPRAAG